MQTEMSRGPLAEDEHRRKGTVGGAFGHPTQPFLFSRAHPPPFPLHFCLHFIRRSMVNHYYLFNANANANANAMVMFGHFYYVWFIVCICLLCLLMFCICLSFFCHVWLVLVSVGTCCVMLGNCWATRESVA